MRRAELHQVELNGTFKPVAPNKGKARELIVSTTKIARMFVACIPDLTLADKIRMMRSTKEAIEKLSTKDKIALRSAYIFSHKVPKNQRDDFSQELFLALWSDKAIQNCDTAQKTERYSYALARVKWFDFWKAYRIRNHYSLDMSINSADNPDSNTFGDMLVSETIFERKIDGELAVQSVYDSLPRIVSECVDKRLRGKGLTKTERIILESYARDNRKILLGQLT